MRFPQRSMIVAAAAAAMLVSAGPVSAHGYAGNPDMLSPATRGYGGAWPVTISRSQRDNGTGCLTLEGTGSGSASLVFGSQKYPFGSFIVINGIFVANVVEPLYGQNGALMFIAHASRGTFGAGVFEDIRGGSNFDVGSLAFGTKNGC